MQASQGKKYQEENKENRKNIQFVFFLFLLNWSFTYIGEVDWISSLLSKKVLVWGGGRC